MIRDLPSLISESRAAGNLTPLVSGIPYFRFLGLQVRMEAEGPVCILPADQKLIGNPRLPALHGGVVGALLEAVSIIHLIWESDSDALPKIVDLSIDYLRSAKPVETYARAIITKHGRRVANVRAEAWNTEPDRPVAVSHAHFLLG